MAHISLEKANFLALVLETLLYGSFTVLFLAALWVIIVQRSVINYKLLTTVITIWVISTAHLILDIIRAIDAFVDLKDGTPGAYYGNLSNPLQAAKTAVYVTLTMVGDGFVIYRCYVVWGRKWYIIPGPLLLLCGTAVGGFGATVAFSQAAPGAEVFLPAIVPWITSFISMTLTTNIVCTFLIAYRIQSIRRNLKGTVHGSVGGDAVVIIMESAAIYSSSVVSLMITYTLGSNAQYTVLDLTSPLIGITFTVIILRVSLGISSRELSTLSPTGGGGIGSRRGPDNVHLRSRVPVAVNVSHLVEVDGMGSDSSMHKGDMV